MTKYLTGKDYTHMCTACQLAIDMAANVVPHAADGYSSDEEGPAMLAHDQRMYCGGHTCVNPPDES
ncbi:MAG: hypothetical protein ACXADF_14895 [Candidatus Thorarchaeota archaeon]|jgi:hypothetical protein